MGVLKEFSVIENNKIMFRVMEGPVQKPSIGRVWSFYIVMQPCQI